MALSAALLLRWEWESRLTLAGAQPTLGHKEVDSLRFCKPFPLLLALWRSPSTSLVFGAKPIHRSEILTILVEEAAGKGGGWSPEP